MPKRGRQSAMRGLGFLRTRSISYYTTPRTHAEDPDVPQGEVRAPDRLLELGPLTAVAEGDGFTLVNAGGFPVAQQWQQFLAQCHAEGRCIYLLALGCDESPQRRPRKQPAGVDTRAPSPHKKA